jgi:hypothetical protein
MCKCVGHNVNVTIAKPSHLSTHVCANKSANLSPCHSERFHVRNLIPENGTVAIIAPLSEDEIRHEEPFGMTNFLVVPL